MPAKIEIPLDLPEIRILNTELSGREIVITVESTREWAICRKCGAEIREFHSYGRLLRLREECRARPNEQSRYDCPYTTRRYTMRTRRFIKRCFAVAVSVVMVWVVSVIPSGTVRAQYPLKKSFASPSTTEVGGYVYWQGYGLNPNTVYYLSYAKNGEHINGICYDSTITTDAEGRWAKLVGPIAPQDVGAWSIGIAAGSYCGEGYVDWFEYKVTAVPFRLSVNNPTLEPGAAAAFSISGAPANQPIRWSTYKDGALIEDNQSYGEYTDAYGNFSKSSSTANFTWNAQALGHYIGRPDADGWSASVGLDSESWLQYGINTTQVPAGNHTAVFNLMIDNNDADDAEILYLDVVDWTTSAVIASRIVTRKQFAATWKYQPFLLPFTSEAGHFLDARVYWYARAYVRSQQVSVDPAWTRYQPGQYMKVAEVYNPGQGGKYQKTAGYKVLTRPKFSLNLTPFRVPVDGYLNHQITGAAPNAPVKWARWLNGSPWDRDILIGYTDANGNFSFSNGPWLAVWSGLWTVKYTIDDVSVEKHYLVDRLPTAIPPDIVYSYTPPAYDPGTGKYYSDAQVHTGGTSPGTGPMVDVSARTWFYDAAGTQPAGAALLNLTTFDGVMTSGGACTQAPDVSENCKKCGVWFANQCVDKEFWTMVSDLTDIGFFMLACAAALAIPEIGPLVAIICTIIVVIRAKADSKKRMVDYKTCICELPGKCSDQVNENCSRLLTEIPIAKTLCQGLPYVPVAGN